MVIDVQGRNLGFFMKRRLKWNKCQQRGTKCNRTRKIEEATEGTRSP